jgi:hypothetical protein
LGNQLELSVDWRSGLTIASTVEDGARDNTTSQEAEGQNTTSQEAEGHNTTSQEAEGHNTTSQEAEGHNTTSQEAEGHNTTSQEAEEVITGMIISSAASICVDNGIDYVTFEGALSNLTLEVGEEITVVGDRTNDAFRLRSVSKIPQDVASRKVAMIKRRLDALGSSQQ